MYSIYSKYKKTVEKRLKEGGDVPKFILLDTEKKCFCPLFIFWESQQCADISLHIHHNPDFPDSELNLGPSCCEVTATTPQCHPAFISAVLTYL